MRLSLCAAALLVSSQVQAGWLTITNPPPSNDIPLAPGASHALTLPGFGGTASVTLVSSVGGAELRLRPYAFYSPASFSNYAANGLDPNGSDQFTIGEFNGTTNNAMNIRFDFTGLSTGFLPAGSVFTVFDLDTFETLTNLQGFNGGGNINTPWLSLVSQFDANGATGGTTNNFASFNVSGGVYNFSANTNGDIPTHYFITTQDLTAVSFDGAAELGPRGYSVAFGTSAVPEPGTFGAAGFAAAGLLWWSRRRKA